MGTLYLKRFIYYVLHLSLSIGVPALIVIQLYGLFETGTTEAGEFSRLRSIAMLTLIIVLVLGLNAIVKWFKSLPDVSAIKMYPTVMVKPVLFGAMYLMLLFSDKYIERVRFITFWAAISNAVAIIPAIAHKKVVKDIVIAETQAGLRR
jgi:hypothetical protein